MHYCTKKDGDRDDNNYLERSFDFKSRGNVKFSRIPRIS